VIDDRGRLFGRWNLIDVAAIVLLLLVFPAGYGAYRLFRSPAPTISAISPTQVPEKQESTVHVSGEYFRTFLRAHIGAQDVKFAISTPTSADITVPADLPAGTYEVALYDEAQELFRKPAALTVVAKQAPPPPQGPTMVMQAVGAFVSLNDRQARMITKGADLRDRPDATADPAASILAVREPEPMMMRVKTGPDSAVRVPSVPPTLQIPAVVRLRCVVTGDQCKVGDSPMVERGTVSLSAPDAANPGAFVSTTFRVDELRPEGSPVTFPPPTEMQVQALGAFIALGDADARLIRRGATLALRAEGQRDVSVADVLAVKAPETGRQRVRISPQGSVIDTVSPGTVQVPALLRVRCVLSGEECRLGDSVLQRKAVVRLVLAVQTRGARPGLPPVWYEERDVAFRIDELRSATADPVFPSANAPQPIIRVQFVVRPEIATMLAVGDVDPSGPASLTSVTVQTQPVTVMATIPGRGGSAQVQQTGRAVEATVGVAAVSTPEGWEYGGKPLRAGEAFEFSTKTYTISGSIVQVRPPEQRRADSR
jgi:hypothetical protein